MSDMPGSHTPPPAVNPSAARPDDWRFRRPQVLIGILLMVAGLVLVVDRLGLLATVGIWRFWPVLVIAMGASMFVSEPDSHRRFWQSRRRFWGTFWTLLGIWLLLRSLGIITIGLGEFLGPLLLIYIGVKLITRTTIFRMPFGSQGPHDAAHLFAMMSETKRITNDNPFTSAQISAFMGGCQLDLRTAIIPPGGEAIIDIFSMMGGTELWVPTNWTVVSQIAPIMGSVDDKRLPAMPSPGGTTEAPRRLLLRGTVIMSGLTIKN
jgi:hypothetical protein